MSEQKTVKKVYRNQVILTEDHVIHYYSTTTYKAGMVLLEYKGKNPNNWGATRSTRLMDTGDVCQTLGHGAHEIIPRKKLKFLQTVEYWEMAGTETNELYPKSFWHEIC